MGNLNSGKEDEYQTRLTLYKRCRQRWNNAVTIVLLRKFSEDIIEMILDFAADPSCERIEPVLLNWRSIHYTLAESIPNNPYLKDFLQFLPLLIKWDVMHQEFYQRPFKSTPILPLTGEPKTETYHVVTWKQLEGTRLIFDSDILNKFGHSIYFMRHLTPFYSNGSFINTKYISISIFQDDLWLYQAKIIREFIKYRTDSWSHLFILILQDKFKTYLVWTKKEEKAEQTKFMNEKERRIIEWIDIAKEMTEENLNSLKIQVLWNIYGGDRKKWRPYTKIYDHISKYINNIGVKVIKKRKHED
jgi:hypothetical protein